MTQHADAGPGAVRSQSGRTVHMWRPVGRRYQRALLRRRLGRLIVGSVARGRCPAAQCSAAGPRLLMAAEGSSGGRRPTAVLPIEHLPLSLLPWSPCPREAVRVGAARCCGRPRLQVLLLCVGPAPAASQIGAIMSTTRSFKHFDQALVHGPALIAGR